MKKIIPILILAAFLVSSCSKTPSEFVGKWKEIDGRHTIEFIEQGDSLLFFDGTSKYMTTDNNDGTVSAEIPGLGVVVFDYSKETDTVSALDDKFKRVE